MFLRLTKYPLHCVMLQIHETVFTSLNFIR